MSHKHIHTRILKLNKVLIKLFKFCCSPIHLVFAFTKTLQFRHYVQLSFYCGFIVIFVCVCVFFLVYCCTRLILNKQGRSQEFTKGGDKFLKFLQDLRRDEIR